MAFGGLLLWAHQEYTSPHAVADVGRPARPIPSPPRATPSGLQGQADTVATPAADTVTTPAAVPRLNPARDCWRSGWIGKQLDDIPGTSVVSAKIVDADNDGQGEVLVTTASGLILLYELQGASWVRQTVDAVSKNPFVLEVGDADNDGKIEVLVGLEVEPIFGNSAAELRLYKFAAGSWSFQTIISSGSAGRYAAAIGDADGDGRNEMVVSGYNFGQVRLFRYQSGGFISSVIGPVPETSSPSAAYPSIGDAMNLGTPQIYVGTHISGNIYVYQWNGSAWLRTTVEENTGYIANPQIADVDNDGSNDLLISKYNGSWGLSVYHFNAARWSANVIEGEGRERAFIADLHCDGRNEVVAISGNAAYTYTARPDGGWNRSTLGLGSDTHVLDVGVARNTRQPAILAGEVNSGKVWVLGHSTDLGSEERSAVPNLPKGGGVIEYVDGTTQEFLSLGVGYYDFSNNYTWRVRYRNTTREVPLGIVKTITVFPRRHKNNCPEVDIETTTGFTFTAADQGLGLCKVQVRLHDEITGTDKNQVIDADVVRRIIFSR